MSNTPDPSQRARMVQHALKESGFLDKHKPKELTDQQKVIVAGCDVADHARQQINTILSAAKASGAPFNETMAGETLYKLLLDGFHTWSKDDLLHLTCSLQASILMDGIKEAHDQGIF